MNCPECSGRGKIDGRIEHLKLDKSSEHYEELLELQKDAKRAIRQASKLKELNPARAESYDIQLAGTLEAINRLAEKTVKGK